MPAPPVAVIEILNDLLDAELNSVFRFMGEGSPYLSRATADVRRPLAEMVTSSQRRAQELYDLIEQLGGSPIPRGLQPEEQYLAFLSLKFLLPKLVDAKKLAIERYENAKRALGNRSPEATAVLDRHLAEHREQLAILEKAAESVARSK
jgi:bacterioferritin (cytochrome b1)